jgi:hypothetical protein
MRGPGDAGRGATWNERGPEAGALGILRPSVPLCKKIWVSNIRIIVFARLRILHSPELRNYGVTEFGVAELPSCRVADKDAQGIEKLESRAKPRTSGSRAGEAGARSRRAGFRCYGRRPSAPGERCRPHVPRPRLDRSPTGHDASQPRCGASGGASRFTPAAQRGGPRRWAEAPRDRRTRNSSFLTHSFNDT